MNSAAEIAAARLGAASIVDHEESSPELSVLMPCLNEAATLGRCIEQAQRTMRDHFIDGEIVIADNGSTDGSAEIARRAGARVVHVEEQGYGRALAAGIAAARGKFVVMADSDDSYDFGHLPRFLEKLREGDELVMGNRFLGGIEPGAMPALHRYLGNPLLSGIGRLFFGSPCSDFHCGMRGFCKRAVERLELCAPGMEFASEMVVKASLYGLRISEAPTTLSPDGRGRPPHLRSFRDGWRHLRFMLLFSPRWLFCYPGLLLMAFGLAGMAWLLPGPRRLGSLTFDVHSLLYAAAALLVGFQAVLFALLAKVFAMTSGLAPFTLRWRRLFRWITLESGLVCGTAVFFAGIVGSLCAVRFWGGNQFGALDGRETLRLVIPAVVNLVMGCQIVMSSFFLSLMGFRQK